MSNYTTMTNEAEASEQNMPQTSYGQPAYPYVQPGQTQYQPDANDTQKPPMYTPAPTVQLPVVSQPMYLQPGQSIPPGANVIYVQAPAHPVDCRLHEVKDCLGLSIFTTLCCNLIFGIIALVFSSRIRQAKVNNDYAEAKSAYKVVMVMNILAIVSGIAIITTVTIIMVTTVQSVYHY